jgi:gamma-glutamylcyclotransferase (GGCT)/AIG2-like uncharacterized protein YtfP
VLYFAYASNMHRSQMQRWCPASRFLKTASLPGFRFVYDGFSVTWDGAVANIVKSDGDTVWGVLYEVTERDRLTLDAFEGYPRDYDHRDVEVRDRDGNVCRAVTYFRTGRAPGPPHPDYERIVIDGAKESGLPEDYIDRVLRVARL